MFYCFDCERNFDEPKTVCVSPGSYWYCEPPEYEAVCPHCGSDDFTELEQCIVCGEPVDASFEWEGLCKDCLDEAKAEIEGNLKNATEKAKALWRLALGA